jgi:hypothetical protein
VCLRLFFHKSNLKYHEKINHSFDCKILPYSCEHPGCNFRFKTKKQRLIHHDNLETECKNERHTLIKKISHYKRLLNDIIKEKKMDQSDLDNHSDYVNLKQSYKELQEKLLDPEFFYHMMGKNFEDTPEFS